MLGLVRSTNAHRASKRGLSTSTTGDEDLWFKEGLKFACTGCGKCCTGSSGHVWLTKTDIVDISKKLDIEKKEFLKKYARWIPRMARWSAIEKQHGDDFHCIFLETNNRCSIYDVRPIQCRTYPYWPGVMKSKKIWEEESLGCEGINNPNAAVTPVETILHTLKDQMEDTIKTYQVGRSPKFDESEVEEAGPSESSTPPKKEKSSIINSVSKRL